MLSFPRFDLSESAYGLLLMADATPAWREVYTRILDELVRRHTTFWAAVDWLTQIGPDPDRARYPKRYKRARPEGPLGPLRRAGLDRERRRALGARSRIRSRSDGFLFFRGFFTLLLGIHRAVSGEATGRSPSRWRVSRTGPFRGRTPASRRTSPSSGRGAGGAALREHEGRGRTACRRRGSASSSPTRRRARTRTASTRAGSRRSSRGAISGSARAATSVGRALLRPAPRSHPRQEPRLRPLPGVLRPAAEPAARGAPLPERGGFGRLGPPLAPGARAPGPRAPRALAGAAPRARVRRPDDRAPPRAQARGLRGRALLRERRRWERATSSASSSTTGSPTRAARRARSSCSGSSSPARAPGSEPFGDRDRDRFAAPTVEGVEYPKLGLSAASNDAAAGVLRLETYVATRAERGAATRFRVARLPSPAAASVTRDGAAYPRWRSVGADAIEIETEVADHRFEVHTGVRARPAPPPAATGDAVRLERSAATGAAPRASLRPGELAAAGAALRAGAGCP